MTAPLLQHYSRGAGKVPMPSPVSIARDETWLNHPSFILLLFLIVILCVLKLTLDTKSILEPKSQTIIVRPVAPEPLPEKQPESIVEKLIHRVKKAREKTPPKVILKEDIKPKKITPKKIEAKKALPPKTALKKITPKKVAPKTITAKKIAPKKMLAADQTPKKVSPKKIAPKKVMAKNISPQNTQPLPLAPQTKITNTVTPKTVASNAIAPQKISRRPKANTDFIPQSKMQSLPKQAQSKPLTLPTAPRKHLSKKSAVALSNRTTDLRDVSFEKPAISAIGNSPRTPAKTTTGPIPTAPNINLDITDPIGQLPESEVQASDEYNEEKIEIIGQILGASDRIKNLKRAIYRKAMELDTKGSPFCCKINNFDFKIRIEGRKSKKVTITFTPADIPFDVISKFERRLPGGLQPCTD